MNEYDSDDDQQFSQQEIIEVPHRGYKTGTFVDGKTTRKSYLIAAVRKGEDQYNCVGVKRVEADHFKFHFWPTDHFFGIEVDGRYDSEAGHSTGTYVGSVTDWDGVVKVLGDLLEAKDDTTVASPDRLLEAFNINAPIPRFTSSEDGTSDDSDDYDGIWD